MGTGHQRIRTRRRVHQARASGTIGAPADRRARRPGRRERPSGGDERARRAVHRRGARCAATSADLRRRGPAPLSSHRDRTRDARGTASKPGARSVSGRWCVHRPHRLRTGSPLGTAPASANRSRHRHRHRGWRGHSGVPLGSGGGLRPHRLASGGRRDHLGERGINTRTDRRRARRCPDAGEPARVRPPTLSTCCRPPTEQGVAEAADAETTTPEEGWKRSGSGTRALASLDERLRLLLGALLSALFLQ